MRKLLIFSISYTFMTICAGCLFESDALGFFGAVCVFLCMLCILFKSRRIGSLLCIVFFGCAVASFSFHAYDKAFVEPCRALDGESKEVTISISDYPVVGNGYISVTGRLQTDGIPKCKTILYNNTDTEKNPENFSLMSACPGDVISVIVKLHSSDRKYGKQDFDNYASGVFLICNSKSEILYCGKESGLLSFLRHCPVRFSEKISGVLSELFDGDVLTFLKSLMLNDKSDFFADESMVMKLSRSGIMHIVAVSGMHVAFLIGFIQFAFGKNRRSVFGGLFLIWFFVLMTGASPSALRAGVMQSMVLLAPLFNRENDSFTSCAFALFLLLAINPYAVFSVSFQLSFSAVAGILLVSKTFTNVFEGTVQHGLVRSAFRYILGISASSAGVMILTVPLTAYHFGSVQILSVFTNILVIWAVSMCFSGGFMASILFCICPTAGRIVSIPVSFLVKYILKSASLVSKIPFSSVYVNHTDNAFIFWIVLVYFLFAFFSCFRKLQDKYKILIPFLISSAGLFLTIACIKLYYQMIPGVYTAIDVGQGQCISVFSGKETVLIDCGSVMTEDNAGDIAGKFLLSCGRNKVNTLILTHLDADHVNGIVHLLNYIDVDEIILSSAFLSENNSLSEILSEAKNHSVCVTYITEDTEAYVGKIGIQFFTPSENSAKTDNEKCLICVVSIGEYDMLVTGDASSSDEITMLETHSLPRIDLLVIGHHGSKYSSSEELLHLCRGADGVVSVGYNTYGHPSQETMQRANEYLKRIFRTDYDGSVQILLDNGEIVLCLKNKMKAAISVLN